MTYANPIAFRNALSDRIKNTARDRGVAVKRLQQLLMFELFLARIYRTCGDKVVLKGGFALELRLENARTTKDIDLRATGSIETMMADIRDAASEVETFISFDITDGKEMTGQGVVYEGRRFRVQAKIGSKEYLSPFNLDISMGDVSPFEAEQKTGDDFFEFMNIAPITHRIYPKETHIAEKLHAYTFPYPAGKTNTRMKDLIDISLMANSETFESGRVLQAIEATFTFRGTHPTPTHLPNPPEVWHGPYVSLRDEDALPWEDLTSVHERARTFLDPLLSEGLEHRTWVPESGWTNP